MQTSKRNPIVSTVVIVALIALLVAVANFVLSPYGLKSQVVWSEFRQQDDLGGLCLGSSLAARAYDPAVVDAAYGSTSFNMGTPTQHPAESYLGLKEALELHDLDFVLYGMDFVNLTGDATLYPARTFENEKWKGDGFFERFEDLAYMLDSADWLFDERSINWLFPWTESQPTGGVAGLLRNAKMRVDGTTLIEAAEVNEKGWHYYGQGYGNYTTVFDYNGDEQTDYNSIEGLDDNPIDESKLRNLTDMADLCAENGVPFIVFVPALPEYSLISLEGHYEDFSNQVREAVEAHGGEFYDFNVASPSFYQPLEEHFSDHQHYNHEGAQAMSEALAKLLAARDAGEDTSSWFITYEERLASIDHISTVRFDEWNTSDGLHLTARGYAGTGVAIEYQFQAKRSEQDDYVTVRDWSTDASFDFAPEDKGSYIVRVNARQVGSNVDFERHTQHVVRVK